jgi:hypothetical protein
MIVKSARRRGMSSQFPWNEISVLIRIGVWPYFLSKSIFC